MKTVLVADDNPAGRELLRSAIESRDVRVIEAADGEEALKLIHENVPDLILLDVQMPSLDGFGVLDALRKGAVGNIRAVAITAMAMESDRERILAAGFDDYIPKPISVLEIRSKVQRWLDNAGAADSAGA